MSRKIIRGLSKSVLVLDVKWGEQFLFPPLLNTAKLLGVVKPEHV